MVYCFSFLRRRSGDPLRACLSLRIAPCPVGIRIFHRGAVLCYCPSRNSPSCEYRRFLVSQRGNAYPPGQKRVQRRLGTLEVSRIAENFPNGLDLSRTCTRERISSS